MSKTPHTNDYEIDLGEIFGVVWAHKLFIISLTAISILLAGNYFITAEKKFTASAMFQIKESSGNSGFTNSKEFGALAALAGLNSGGTSSNINSLLERINRREFILDFNNKYKLDLDPYFNSYDPNYKDPFWKATIKEIIGWQKTQLEKSAIVEHNIISSFQRNVVLVKNNKSGTVTVSVTHVGPEIAAEYANNIMEDIRQLIKFESSTAKGLQLDYLSRTLADALQEMEEAQENLKNYALKNSAMAQEKFIADSLTLDQTRMEKRKVEEISSLLSIIESLSKSGNLDSNSYQTLRSTHPLVDGFEFRRIMGMSETISDWTWPEPETIEAASTTLRDRMSRLDMDIKSIEENAKIYAASAEDLAQLTRDAKIAEATYTVLIEQVKSQSLAAGFQPETFKTFQYATPPLVASSPKGNRIFPLGAVLGIFMGFVLAFINAMRKGVFYSRGSLVSTVNADLSLKSKSINSVSKKSISDIIKLASKRRIVALDEAALKLTNKNIIYVFNSGGRLNASNAVKLLATQSALSGRSVVLCDTTGRLVKNNKGEFKTTPSDLPIKNIGNNVSIMKGLEGSSFFTTQNFNSTIKDLMTNFDQVFICSNSSNAKIGLMALSQFKPGFVLIAGLRKTKKIDIKNLETKQPIDLLLYD